MRSQPVIQVGEQAPDFTLPTVHRDGVVSLSEYRGKHPLLLVLNRGLWCSFCRRYVVQLTSAREKLLTIGVETLVVVATEPSRAQLYVRFHPTRVPLAADPEYSTHRAYGLSAPLLTPEILQRWDSMRVPLDQVARNPTDLTELSQAMRSLKADSAADLRESLPLMDIVAAQLQRYQFDLTEPEEQDRQRNRAHPAAQVLIDREGIVRWRSVQHTDDAPNGLGNLPTDEEILAAARKLDG